LKKRIKLCETFGIAAMKQQQRKVEWQDKERSHTHTQTAGMNFGIELNQSHIDEMKKRLEPNLIITM